MLEQGEYLNQKLCRYDPSFIIALVSKKKSKTIQRNMLRNHLNEMQEVELKKRFSRSPYLKRGEALSLAKKLNLDQNTICQWFYAQRFKSKNKTRGVNQGK